MAVTLKDDQDGIVAVLVDEQFNMRGLEPGPVDAAPIHAVESRFRMGLIAPTTRAGTYTVYVSVGHRDGTPAIALPLVDGDGQRRYPIGRISCIK